MQTNSSTTVLHICAFAYKFTVKEREPESGLDYFGARYYARNMGRFLSPDWSAQAEPRHKRIMLRGSITDRDLSSEAGEAFESHIFQPKPAIVQYSELHKSENQLEQHSRGYFHGNGTCRNFGAWSARSFPPFSIITRQMRENSKPFTSCGSTTRIGITIGSSIELGKLTAGQR
jgi:RHS repeat-associated protein